MVAATAVLVGGALTAGRAQALPLSPSDGVRAAAEAVSPVEQTACWRFGWHGWGWYPYCGPRLLPPGPRVVYEDAYDAWVPGCRDVTVRERQGPRVVVRHIRRCD